MKLVGDFVRTLSEHKGNVFLTCTVLIMAFGLKYHFSVANSEDLAWILFPLSWAVGKLSMFSFHAENGVGYVSDDGLIIIAPVCAGVNFLIAVLLTGAGTIIMTAHSFGRKLMCLISVMFSAYLYALLINTFRIVLAIELYNLDIYGNWLTAERLHRVAGILLYFPSLLSYGLVVQGLLARLHSEQVIGYCFFWYICLSIGVPLLAGSFQNSGILFFEHGLTIILVCGCCIGAYFLLKTFQKKKRVRKIKRDLSVFLGS